MQICNILQFSPADHWIQFAVLLCVVHLDTYIVSVSSVMAIQIKAYNAAEINHVAPSWYVVLMPDIEVLPLYEKYYLTHKVP
jgi:hypothetical protein